MFTNGWQSTAGYQEFVDQYPNKIREFDRRQQIRVRTFAVNKKDGKKGGNAKGGKTSVNANHVKSVIDAKTVEKHRRTSPAAAVNELLAD